MKFLFILICLSANSFSQASSYGNVDGTINATRFRLSFSPNTATIEDANLANNSFMIRDNQEIRHIWLFSASYDFSRHGILADPPLTTLPVKPLIKEVHSLRLGASKVFSSKFMLGLKVPFHRVMLAERNTGLDKFNFHLGDIELMGKYQFYKKNKINITLNPFIVLPTGSNEYLTSDKSTSIGLDGLFSYQKKNSKLYASAGYAFNHGAKLNFNYNSGHVDIIDHKSQLRFGIGYAHDFLDKLGVNAEIYGRYSTTFTKYRNPIQTQLSLRYELKKGLLGLYGGYHFEGFKFKENEKGFFLGLKTLYGKTSKFISDERKAEVKDFLELSLNVQFDSDSDVIQSISYERLNEFSDKLIKYAADFKSVTIEGHTDSLHDESYNMNLSNKRAIAIKNYLVSRGVHASKLQTLGFGESRLKTLGNTEEDHAQNRRVEMKVNFDD